MSSTQDAASVIEHFPELEFGFGKLTLLLMEVSQVVSGV